MKRTADKELNTTKEALQMTENERSKKKSKIDPMPDNSEVLWTMTAQQSADLRALHDSIQLGPQDKAPSPESHLAEEDRPPVGSTQWHERRRESHKLVERKRREAINDGINKIASIVPGCEKNKGSILNRAANYIKQLKEQEASLLERFSLEKLLTEQSVQQLRQEMGIAQKQVQDLTNQSESLKRELEATLAENERLKDRLKKSSHQ
ncbi:hypothetical protein BY458DRAFT_499738 [Sporodiniella umbellata]|nr:hypothetical protein BY458DRAFT_499738 [Sporodiniella umbellata]